MLKKVMSGSICFLGVLCLAVPVWSVTAPVGSQALEAIDSASAAVLSVDTLFDSGIVLAKGGNGGAGGNGGGNGNGGDNGNNGGSGGNGNGDGDCDGTGDGPGPGAGPEAGPDAGPGPGPDNGNSYGS